MEKTDFIETVLDEISPQVFRKYKSSDILNNPELDNIAHRELKKKALELFAAGDREKGNILLSFIQEKPRFALFTRKDAGDVYWYSLIHKKEFDHLLFENETAKRRFDETWGALGKLDEPATQEGSPEK
jgi:hypothetical protein